MGNNVVNKAKAGALFVIVCGLLFAVSFSGCMEEQQEPELKNIVDTASANDDFDTLVTAVTAAGLVNTLSNEEEQYTVFAPTDAAFAKLDPTFLANLVNNDTANLTKILTYHVISGKVMSTDLSDNMTVTTVEGTPLTITITDGNVYVNDAMVTTADIECSNGVIHVINTVLVP